LEAYDKKWENDAKITPNTKSLNPDMIADFERLFNDWSEKIAAAIEETENERKEDKEAGPRNEIEFWRQRMRKLYRYLRTTLSQRTAAQSSMFLIPLKSQEVSNPWENLAKS
jgi:hypothetical protein